MSAIEPIDQVNRLLAKVKDSDSPEEQRTAAFAAARLMLKHGFVVSSEAQSAPAGSHDLTLQLLAATTEVLTLTVRVNALERELRSAESELRSKRLGASAATSATVAKLESELKQWRAYGAKQEAQNQAQREREQRHEQWLAEYRASQESESIARLIPELNKLFDREPVQPGADKIAKKVGCNALVARKAIAKLVADGVLVAAGTTRNRTYSRPLESGRESFTSEPHETEDDIDDSRPSEVRRKRAA